MNTLPEITDPLLKSLVDDAAHLPRMAALAARTARERKSPRAAFRPLPGIVWLLQFRATQAALALLLLAAMIEGGALLTGERPSGKNPDAGRIAFWSDDESGKVNVDPAAEGSFFDTPVTWTARGTTTDFDKVIAFDATTGGTTDPDSDGFTNKETWQPTQYLRNSALHFSSVNPATTGGATVDDVTTAPVLSQSLMSKSRFFLTANSKSPEQSFDYSLGTGNIGKIEYSGGNTITPTTTFPFTNIYGGGQITSGLRSGGQAITGDAMDQLLNPAWNSQTGQGQVVPVAINQPVFDTRKTADGTTVATFDGFVNYGSPIAGKPTAVTDGSASPTGATGSGTLNVTQNRVLAAVNLSGTGNFAGGNGNLAVNSVVSGTTFAGNTTPGPTFEGKVQSVQNLFAEAKGFYDSGRYDLAYKRYDQVLDLDPKNVAARKGQEDVIAAKSQYANEAYNETRSLSLYNVTKEWETAPRKYTNGTLASGTAAAPALPEFVVGGTTAAQALPEAGDWDNGPDSLAGVTVKTGTTRVLQPSATGTYASGTQGADVYDPRRIDLATAMESKIGGPMGPKTLVDPSAPAVVPNNSGAKPVQAPQATPAPVQVDARKLIRDATLDFEVASFDKALDTVTKVSGEEQGYVLTQDSEKGENGKLQGTIIVKLLPGNLDRFLLKLRLLGDLKSQNVTGQDVTKDYYDTEARIRNAVVTEERLIEMMKTRTGKVSELLEVENEIAKVRGEIEQMQGTLKYMDSLVQYATVTITLEEKDLNQAAAYTLTQQAQLFLFVKDVEKAFADAKSVAADAKAQTLESHIERDEAGHVVATIHLLLPPETSEDTITKLKAIGRIQHYNSQTLRVARDDSDNSDDSSDAPDNAKVDRDKVDFTMTIQLDAENPVQGTNISVQSDQVEEKTNEIKKAAAEDGVEVKGAEFNRMRNGVEVSAMLLRMPMSKYNTFLEQIKSLGKVKDFTVSRREDATATGDAPAEIVLQIFSQGNIVAPETGLWATVRHTIGQGFAALMWSVRMAGVSLAFIAPWAVIAGLAGWVVMRRKRRMANKRG